MQTKSMRWCSRMKSVIKVKIYAKKTKTQLLRQSLGNSRFVWNKLLEKEKGKYVKENLKKSHRQTLQQIARKLGRSLKNFLAY